MAGSTKDVVTGVSTDSRSIQRGDLFVALRGERHDGHDHLEEVRRKGAIAAIVDRGVKSRMKNLVRTKDTLRALGDLAHDWRKRFPIPVVAVTGSNGKTTVKDLIARVLATKYRVLKTEGNFNNLIGLPLTIFRIKGDEEIAVLEMGMNRPGEIDRLAEIASPKVGVVTNVARAHLEGLGGLVGVARAKGELLDRLVPGGVAVLNRDDRFFEPMKKRALRHGARVASFGTGRGSDYRVLRSNIEGLRGIRFAANLKGRKASFRMSTAGRHNVSNALAALAVADQFGVPINRMRRALGGFRPSAKRMEMVRLPKGIRVINDSYNANPDSMTASLRLLQDLGRGGSVRTRTVAILGDMFELGRQAPALHREVGREAAECGVTLLFAVGSHAKEMVAAARRAGLSAASSLPFSTVESSLPVIRSFLKSGDLVLVKGSRGMKMERVTEDLKKRRRA